MSSNGTGNRRKLRNCPVSDRVKPNRQCLQALKTAVFAVSERTALTETLFGTEKEAAWGLKPVIEVKNPANRLVEAPCAGFLFHCYSRPKVR